MKLKIALIGAGSLIWGATTIHDLSLTPGLRGSTVVLVDIDRKRLSTISRFAKRYSSERKSDLTFQSTTDLREAIRNADFVVNTAMSGGHEYYEKMRDISEKWGYYRGINSSEWNMVSDYHTIWGYYQFKLAENIANAVESLSPDAWLLQLSNPVFEITTMIGRRYSIKLIGLCHGHLGYRTIIGSLGLDEESVKAESVGVNHVIWLTNFLYGKENAYRLLDEWLEKNYITFKKNWRMTSKINPLNTQLSPAAIDMYKTYGLFPVGDTARSGTWKYHRNFRLKQKWYGALGGFDSPVGWKYYLDMERRGEERVLRMLENESTIVSNLFPSGVSDETLVPIIDSIANDSRGTYQVNVINRNLLDGVGQDVAVETPGIVDGKGAHPYVTKGLPQKIRNLVIKPRVTRMEWALDAYNEGDKGILLEWLTVDPRTRTNIQAEGVLREILEMPENREMSANLR